jgi:hypothetical protein
MRASMRRCVIMLAMAATFAGGGCAARAPEPESELSWQRASDDAVPLSEAWPDCRARALEQTRDVRAPGLGAKAAGGAAVECMRTRGWVPTEPKK